MVDEGGMNRLPFELVEHLADFLDLWDLDSLQAVSSQFYKIVKRQIESRRYNFKKKVETSISSSSPLCKWTWTTVHPSGDIPFPHWSSAMIVMPTLPARALLFGGETESNHFFNDLNVLYLANYEWKKIPLHPESPVPPARGFPCLHPVFIESKHEEDEEGERQDFSCPGGGGCDERVREKRSGHWYAVLFGGQSRTEPRQWSFHNDLWLLNLTTWKWRKIEAENAPCPRVGHRSCILRNKLWVYGGTYIHHQTYYYLDDLHTFDFDLWKWSRVHCNGCVPPARQSPTLTPLNDHSFVVVGGNDDVQRRIVGNRSDVYIFDIDTLTWKFQDLTPITEYSFKERWCHGASNIADHLFIVVSGWGSTDMLKFDDLWFGDLDTQQWFHSKAEGDIPQSRLFFTWLKVFDYFIMAYGQDDATLHILRCE